MLNGAVITLQMQKQHARQQLNFPIESSASLLIEHPLRSTMVPL